MIDLIYVILKKDYIVKKKLFLLIGAPGSGKTTDASIIAGRHADCIVHYSTGDMLREEIAKETNLGRTIGMYISKGALVPLDIILTTIISAIRNAPTKTVLIDGYPRSTEQMHALNEILEKEEEIELVSVIEVAVSEETAKERILGRIEESDVVRTDDNMEVFKDRMNIYTASLAEIQAYYTQKKLLKVFDGNYSLDIVVSMMELFIRARAQ